MQILEVNNKPSFTSNRSDEGDNKKKMANDNQPSSCYELGELADIYESIMSLNAKTGLDLEDAEDCLFQNIENVLTEYRKNN